MITAVAITWTLITCCYRPFGVPSRSPTRAATGRGRSCAGTCCVLFGALLAVSLGAIGWALLGPNAPTEANPVDRLNLVWAGVSALLSGIACLVCFERPRSHREELFETDHAGRLLVEGQELPCNVHRLSTVDASLRLHAGKSGFRSALRSISCRGARCHSSAMWRSGEDVISP